MSMDMRHPNPYHRVTAPLLPDPAEGETCGQLTAIRLGARMVWIYDASYDDAHLCLRRAETLEAGWGIPFLVTVLNGERVSGWYAYTRRDPRPIWLAWQLHFALPEER